MLGHALDALKYVDGFDLRHHFHSRVSVNEREGGIYKDKRRDRRDIEKGA